MSLWQLGKTSISIFSLLCILLLYVYLGRVESWASRVDFWIFYYMYPTKVSLSPPTPSNAFWECWFNVLYGQNKVKTSISMEKFRFHAPIARASFIFASFRIRLARKFAFKLWKSQYGARYGQFYRITIIERSAIPHLLVTKKTTWETVFC